MGLETSGRSRKLKKGELNGHMNGHISSRPVRPAAPRKSRLASLFSMSTRLLLWYAIITAIFRCPSSTSHLTDESPKICKPYLIARSHVSPYIEPYYHTYVGPYVDKAQPYIDQFNQQIYSPAANFTSRNYQAYGAPRVEKARQYAEAEWAAMVKPQLEAVEAKAKAQYESSLAPHVHTAQEAIGPYWTEIKSKSAETFEEAVLPAYRVVVPYARQAYGHGHHITAHILIPYAHQAQKATVSFLSRTIWPQLRILYGENVEPQLMRISERLGRYRDGKKLEAIVEAVDSSSALSSVTSNVAATASSVAQSVTGASSTAAASQSSATPSPSTEAEVRERIESDLKLWQHKFAKAADKGAEDLRERVAEITKHQVQSQAHGVGQALIVQLEETSIHAIERLKSTIKSEVSGLPEEASVDDIKSAHNNIITAIRSSGVSIREKAQALRDWKQKYDNETVTLVKAASDSTLDVIDNIRDLGLQ